MDQLPSIAFLWIGCIACSIVLHNLALKLFPKLGLTDFPEKYALKRLPIPYPTGIITVGLFSCLLLGFAYESKQAFGLLIGVISLGIMSFIDDRKQISAPARIALQMCIAFIIFGTGTRIYSITSPIMFDGIIKLDSIIIPFSLFDNPPLFSGIFTVIWLVLTMNALNWFDGIPGQVNCISVISFLVIGALALSNRMNDVHAVGQETIAILAFSLSGLSLGAAFFDFPPPKVVMGDTGAMFLGLMLGVLTIYSGGKVATTFLVLGVPIVDSVFVVIRRLYRKKAPWKGNAIDEHLHHRLLLCNWSQSSIIGCTVLIGTIFGISALFMSTFEKIIAGMLLILIMLLLNMYTTVTIKAINDASQ